MFENEKNIIGKTHHFQFTGKTSEYFGIWIVNILLTIITFGIYSAWAKVRREIYLSSHIQFLKHGLGYHATGGQIFIARLFACLIIFISFVCFSSPITLMISYLLYLFLYPFLIQQAIFFKARFTSYRNVRFYFSAHLSEAYFIFLAGPILSILSFGLLFPLYQYWIQNYVLNGLSYGALKFSTHVKAREVYRIWLLPFLSIILCLFALLIGCFIAPKLILILLFLAYIFVICMHVFFLAKLRNLLFSSLQIDQKIFLKSTLNPWRYVWIFISNTVLTILSLGFLHPWSVIRYMRYLWSKTSAYIQNDIGEIQAYKPAVYFPIAAEYLSLQGVKIEI